MNRHTDAESERTLRAEMMQLSSTIMRHEGTIATATRNRDRAAARRAQLERDLNELQVRRRATPSEGN